MTTFTKLADGEQPSISVFPTHKLSKINDNIYGGFTEHMGRCIYGGLYDPDNPNKHLIDEHGFRTDVIEAFKELRVPVVRYPGGNFVATYHWLDGVGPRDQRPRRPELAWLGEESNQFGTDEFMQWCRVVGTEPYLCLNFGTGTLDEALAWLEYCNSDRNTHYANLRRRHGHEQPYNVKYWALGNETWGPWQVEQTTHDAYAHKAYQWAKALKLLDPTITLVLCGETGHTPWDFHTLTHCLRHDPHALGGPVPPTTNLIDMHSIHIYTASADPTRNALAPRSAERAIQIAAALIDLARIHNRVPPSLPRPTLCVDEWNVWDPVRAPGDQGAEETYTLSDALAVAAWLNVLVRQSRDVGMANLAQSVNVIAPLVTTARGLVRQTTWWPLWLFARFMRGWTVGVHVRAGCYEGATEPAWLRGVAETPWLDVSAAVDGEGWVSVAVVNCHLQEGFEVEVVGVREGGEVQRFEVSGERWDVVNTEAEQNVGVREVEWDGRGKVVFPRQSLTLLRWRQ